MSPTQQFHSSVPVNNLDSSWVKTSPVEYEPNLAVVYLRTRSGPQGPKPLFNLKSNRYISIQTCRKKLIIFTPPRQKKNKNHLIIFWGVKLDSHKWFIIAPFHVALKRVSRSDCSDSCENPADPTKTKCFTCSGCYKYKRQKEINQKSRVTSDMTTTLQKIINSTKKNAITLRAYFAATYPPKECPSNIKLLRFLDLRHSSKESMNHASVSVFYNR